MLTLRQQAFVAEYLIDLNAAGAAERAGYSPGSSAVAGSRLLSRPQVAEAVRAAMDERSAKLGRDALDVLKDLRATAEEAREAKNFPAAVKAYELELKHYGALAEQAARSVNAAASLTPAQATAELLRVHGIEDAQKEALPFADEGPVP